MNKDTLFQYRCYNDHPFIKVQGESLFKEFQAGRRRKVRDKNAMAKYRKAFKTALAGLYLGGAFDAHGSVVRIPLKEAHYTGNSRISPVFTRELLAVFGWLQSNGYLEQMVPPDSANGRWRPAGYRLTEKWQLWQLILEPSPPDHEEIQAWTRREKAAPFVELRDNGKRLRLRSSGQKKFSEALLQAYELEINDHQYSLGRTLIPPFLFSLTRIYSRGSYDYGGRFYSYFQTYRSQLRLHLQIDGEPVCEVDYRYLHPSLLYLEEGLELQHDPYEIEGFPRSVAKVAFQILLNSRKAFPPVSSLAYFLNRSKHSKKAKDDPQWQALAFDAATCTRLAEALKTRNEAIAHHFCKGKGLELQHTDSLLASVVLQAFIRYHPGSVVIPIHDSFIIKQKDLPLLFGALGHAEISLSAIRNTPIRRPMLKASALKGVEIPEYEELLRQADVQGEEGPSYKEEQLVQEVIDLFPDEQDEHDAYALDADLEDPNFC